MLCYRATATHVYVLPAVTIMYCLLHWATGRAMRPLNASETRQIAGRAGRYGAAGWGPRTPPAGSAASSTTDGSSTAGTAAGTAFPSSSNRSASTATCTARTAGNGSSSDSTTAALGPVTPTSVGYVTCLRWVGLGRFV